jgi:hypothetical protein
MATPTTNYAFDKPTVGGDTDLWGGFLNGNWDSVDSLLSGGTPINGIQINSGNAVFTSLDATTGTLTTVTLTDCVVGADTLSISNEISEGVQAIAGGATPVIDPANGGTLATWTLTAATEHTPVITLSDGESITLLIQASTGTIDWGALKWINGTPVLDPSTLNVIELFRYGGLEYGVFVGSDVG